MSMIEYPGSYEQANELRLRLRALFVAHGKSESAADQYQAAWEHNRLRSLTWNEFYDWVRDQLRHGVL